jgi:hypothetical protein
VRSADRLVRSAGEAHGEHDRVQHAGRRNDLLQRADPLGWELRQHDSNTIRSSQLTDDRPLDIQLSGQALGSKSAGPTTYLPGTCPAMGGDASGSAIPIEPATFCCRP